MCPSFQHYVCVAFEEPWNKKNHRFKLNTHASTYIHNDECSDCQISISMRVLLIMFAKICNTYVSNINDNAIQGCLSKIYLIRKIITQTIHRLQYSNIRKKHKNSSSYFYTCIHDYMLAMYVSCNVLSIVYYITSLHIEFNEFKGNIFNYWWTNSANPQFNVISCSW